MQQFINNHIVIITILACICGLISGWYFGLSLKTWWYGRKSKQLCKINKIITHG